MYLIGKLIRIFWPEQAEIRSSSTRLIKLSLIGFIILMIIFYFLGAFGGI